MKTAVSQVIKILDERDDSSRMWLIGEPWQGPPVGLVESLRQVTGGAFFPYPPAAGEAEFRIAVANDHLGRNLPLDCDQVVATHGAKGGLYAVMKCLLEPGDEVLHPTPCYPAYRTIVSECGAFPIAIDQPGDHFTWTRSLIEEQITERTRAMVLSSPANPGGATLTAEHARLLVDICRDHRLRLICDEAYEAFGPTDSGSSHQPASWDPTLETVIQVRSFSKSHAVCGWRIGYVAADRRLVDRVATWQGAHLNPPNILAQRALARAVSVPEAYCRTFRRDVRRRLQELAQCVSRSGWPAAAPAGGFYLWIDVRPAIEALGLQSSLELCLEFAQKHGIGIWPGEDFLAQGHVRLSAVSVPHEQWPCEMARLARAIEASTNVG